MNKDELYEELKDLAYYSYFFSGVLATVSSMPEDMRATWLNGICKKLNRAKNPKENISERLMKIFQKVCPEAFEEELEYRLTHLKE